MEANKQPQTPAESPQKQRGLFKRKRAGVVLTKSQVKAIKRGRKKLRKELRAQGIRKKKDFELTASSLGLYFDKSKKLALLWWVLWGKGKWIWPTLAAALMGVLYGMSVVTDLHGHFTVSMSDRLFREGFSISEESSFANATAHLFASPGEGVPCISILRIPENVDKDALGSGEEYFAYTFYVKNEGESIQDVDWSLNIRSESQHLSDAAWMMIFIDGKATIYAKADPSGTIQAIPSFDENSLGYPVAPMASVLADPEGQCERINPDAISARWRIKPVSFLSKDIVAHGRLADVEPLSMHRFTVVVWLEGDDPHCTNELIGGHIGMEFVLEMVDPDNPEDAK